MGRAHRTGQRREELGRLAHAVIHLLRFCSLFLGINIPIIHVCVCGGAVLAAPCFTSPSPNTGDSQCRWARIQGPDSIDGFKALLCLWRGKTPTNYRGFKIASGESSNQSRYRNPITAYIHRHPPLPLPPAPRVSALQSSTLLWSPT